MSRFFVTASDSDSESSSQDETCPKNERKKVIALEVEETEVKRLVRTPADKQRKELQSIIHQIGNLKKIRDYTSLLHAFGEMVKVFEKYGDMESAIYFFRCLADIDNFVGEAWDDKFSRQNMTKTASKSLVALRQKVRKYSKVYSDQIQTAQSVDDERLLEESKDEGGNTSSEGDRGGSESNEWGGSDDFESGDYDKASFKERRDYFLKKSTVTVDEKPLKSEKKRVKKVVSQKDKEEKGWQTIMNLGFSNDSLNLLREEVSIASVSKILTVVSSAKMKRHSSNRQKVHMLQDLLSVAEANGLGLPLIIKVRLAIVNAALDYNLNFLNAMKPEYWGQILNCMTTLTDSLIFIDFDINPNAEEEELEHPPFVVRGCVVSLVERLDDEFNKMLRDCDPYGDEYMNRLKDENTMTLLIDKVCKYVELRNSKSDICRIYLCKIGHLHYKLDKNAFEVLDLERQVPSLLEMDRLCKFVYRNDASFVLRTRAILAQIYHLALHDRWLEARDLMLMSHLQENIQYSDHRTQMLFNRAMAQLGLCAFRSGRINDAHSCLADLLTAGRVKELLGQGFLPFRLPERTREQELRDRQFQLPFHMHIPLDLVECVYLISAMIIDVPYLSPHSMDPRRRIISKPLYQMLRLIEKQCLLGPPESMREHVMAASKALRSGNWKSCVNYLINPKMTMKVWSKIQQPTPVLTFLENAIKSASLLTYVLSFSSIYDSIKISYLADMFEMDIKAVRQQLASIIASEELNAALDEPTDTLVPQRCRHTLVHSYAIQLLDKISLLLDTNERSCRIGQNVKISAVSSSFKFLY